MTKLNFQWRADKGQHQIGESLFLNRVRVGYYNWNTSRSKSDSKDDTKDYSGSSILPQQEKIVYGREPEEVKEKVEKKVTIWFTETLKGGANEKPG